MTTTPIPSAEVTEPISRPLPGQSRMASPQQGIVPSPAGPTTPRRATAGETRRRRQARGRRRKPPPRRRARPGSGQRWSRRLRKRKTSRRRHRRAAWSAQPRPLRPRSLPVAPRQGHSDPAATHPSAPSGRRSGRLLSLRLCLWSGLRPARQNARPAPSGNHAMRRMAQRRR